MNRLTNPINEIKDEHESTYTLLLRSEEKTRNAFEILIYPFLGIGVIIAICQFAFQALDIPVQEIKPSPYLISMSVLRSRS